METIAFQCGHCKNVLAISVDHLGGQVHCPHCQVILQTPSPEPAPEALHIFTDHGAAGESPTGIEPAAELTKFKPRPIFTKSVFAMYALIFLIPYSILTTIAIIYLVTRPQPVAPDPPIHPFDMIRDPVPDSKKGGAKRVLLDNAHEPLAEHQKTKLRKPIQVGGDGDLLVTPEKIVLTKDGDLRLLLRTRNTSKNSAFEPSNELFVKQDTNNTVPSYTFLQSGNPKIGNVSGAYLGYRKNPDDNEEEGNAVLGPNREVTVVLTTYSNPKMAEIVKGNDRHLWRVELRRGFVKYRGRDVSATAIIGVEFTSAEIER